MSDRKIIVSTDALQALLNAINGPAHHIRELQVTRSLPAGMSNDNPINVLISEFNDKDNHFSYLEVSEIVGALREAAGVLMELGKSDYALSYSAIADHYS